MAVPVSFVGVNSASLPLEDGPFHVDITIPFSLVMQDSDLTLAQIQSRESWATWLFRRQHKTTPVSRAVQLALPRLRQIWQQLSALLFGREEPTLYAVLACDADHWDRIADSNIFWTVSTGVTNNDSARVVVLKADEDSMRGGIRFTWEEMGENEKMTWTDRWMGLRRLPLYTPEPARVTGLPSTLRCCGRTPGCIGTCGGRSTLTVRMRSSELRVQWMRSESFTAGRRKSATTSSASEPGLRGHESRTGPKTEIPLSQSTLYSSRTFIHASSY